MKFDKPSLKIDQQIDLLKKRGLILPDEIRATRYLQSIGYYRLSAYFLPFQKIKNEFDPDTTFDSILDLYIADRKLRILVMDALERIEVAVRTVISNTLSNEYGPHWYLNCEKVFKPKFCNSKKNGKQSGYEIFLNNIETYTGRTNHNHQSPACKHYYSKYTEPKFPPSWSVIEVLPMGTWSKIFPNIRKTEFKRKIARFFSFKHEDFGGWIHALTLIRNNCAHHGRFWNHKFPPKAKNIQKYTHPGILINSSYVKLAIIQAFLIRFTNRSTWSKKLYKLLKDWPLDIHHYMQFPETWKKMSFWKISI